MSVLKEYDPTLHNIHEALERFKKILVDKGFEIVEVKDMNFGRHKLVKAKYTKNDYSNFFDFYLIFQRQWFLSFPKYYGVDEPAVSINLNLLKQAIYTGVDRLVFAHSSGKFFMVDPLVMKDIAESNKWIRKTKKTGEVVVHLPLSRLKRII